MLNKKDLAKLKKTNRLEYVVKHGEWRLQREKKLSAILPMPYKILNPEKAYQAAKEMLERAAKPRRPLFNHRGQTQLEEFLGVPPPHEEPWPGARKVPHTCHQWY